MKPQYQRITRLLFSALCVLSAYAQTPAPTPAPELKPLEAWIGDWKYQGTSYSTPIGKAGTFAGTQRVRMILDGRFLEARWQDKGDYGDQKGVLTSGVEINGYDPAKKAYAVFVFENDGSTSTGSLTVSGKTWTGVTSRAGVDGKVYQTRSVTTFSDDGRSATTKVAISPDGSSWVAAFEYVMKRK